MSKQTVLNLLIREDLSSTSSMPVETSALTGVTIKTQQTTTTATTASVKTGMLFIVVVD